MKKLFLRFSSSFSSPISTPLFGDAGILISRDKQQPDAAILSLEEMEITVRIDNGDARVFVRQVLPTTRERSRKGITSSPAQPRHHLRFRHTGRSVRLPAVILERKRAGRSITNSSSSRSIPACSRWASRVGRSEPDMVFGAVSFPSSPTERSGWKLSTTSPSRWKISSRILRFPCGRTLIRRRQLASQNQSESPRRMRSATSRRPRLSLATRPEHSAPGARTFRRGKHQTSEKTLFPHYDLDPATSRHAPRTADL